MRSEVFIKLLANDQVLAKAGYLLLCPSGTSAQERCTDEISLKRSIVIRLQEPLHSIDFLLKFDYQAPLLPIPC